MQTGWRLERSYLAGAGFPESRLEGLDIDWSEPLDQTGHAALWADNGTGKTTITALRFAVYLPHPRDFIRGNSDRSLAKLVHSGDVCHIVEQATRVVDGELQRVVVGMVADWDDGGTQDLDNPSKLRRMFYGWVTGELGPTISDLPFRTNIGRRATRTQFVEAVRGLLPDGGALPPHPPSDHQTQWRKWLTAAGVDLDQVRFQAVMNASEGGVDSVMRFSDSDQFVQWLVGAITPTSTVEQITKSIEVLRTNAAARPRWSNELALWKRLIDPLLNLAIAHEEVTEHRRSVATAAADGAAIVADAEATVVGLRADADTATKLRTHHETLRREAGATLRRAQAHRLRMQLRGAELRADAAARLARDKRDARGQAARTLAAWQLVGDVREATATATRLAGLEERLAAAEKETEALRGDERRHRHDLARLLTDRRDTAVAELRSAREQSTAASHALEAVENDLQDAWAEHATAAEQDRQLRAQVDASEHTMADAVAAGLLTDEADPAALDASLAEQTAVARRTRKTADHVVENIGEQVATAQRAASAAKQRATTARNDAAAAESQLRQVDRRVDALARDERLLGVAGDMGADLWIGRVRLNDALRERAGTADAHAADARAAVAAARRTVDAVGVDGLLPASQIAEEVAAHCQEADLPAWPGWRWLADTMNPQAAAAFAAARPEIASGVVVSHPGMVDRAVEAARTVDIDVALWVGAVVDSAAAMTHGDGAGEDGTRAHVLMPHPGIFDREAATQMVAAATASLQTAIDRRQDVERRAEDARNMLAALEQLWTDLPDDPRAELTEKIRTAQGRQRDAESEEQAAIGRLDALARQRRVHQRDRDAAQQAIDDATETRRLLVPVVAAAASLARAREQLPVVRRVVADARRRVDELGRRKPQLAADSTAAKELVRDCARRRDDAAEALRAAGLLATTDGPIPADDGATIRARLESVQAALEDAAVDPELHQQVQQTRQRLADLNIKLDADTARRRLAEQFAASDGARHVVALEESVRSATQQEALAREEYARAQEAADTAAGEYKRRVEDRSSDRSSPDVEGLPPAEAVPAPDDTERFAEQLDDLSGQLSNTQRNEERLAEEAAATARTAEQSTKLVDASAKPLRYLADTTLTGRRATDVDELIDRIGDVNDRLRQSEQALSASEQAQQQAANTVRAHANGPQARKVEEADDTRVVDLLLRLRADEQLPTEAQRIAEQLEQRATSLRDDLDRHDQHVRTCATMLQVQAATAIQRLRAYQNQSRLPEGLEHWSQRQFVIIDHEPMPDDESVAIDRVARVVHSLLVPGSSRSDAQTLLFAAARALVDAPFRVRLLKPHTDLSIDRVDVAELKNFSGGQRVTAGVLLYATMTRVRATGDVNSIGWLWLDNPFGQASADQFVRTMRRAADQLGLQLLFTAAPKDKGALSMFDRTIMLARRSRPSSGEKVVVVDDGSRDVVDLTLVQKDVAAVLGG
ncbi:MAG: hypothetical protein ACRDQA_08815 [Nocardioidaceae bacterium]